jgi:hypothetical protein
MKSVIFWDVTSCSLLRCNRRFGGTYRLHLQSRRKFQQEPASKQVASSCWNFLRLWEWRRYVPPKRRLHLNRLHGVTSQKIILFTTLSSPVNSSGYILPNGRMVSERWLGTDADKIYGRLCGRIWGKPRTTWVRIADLLAEIWTRELQNATQYPTAFGWSWYYLAICGPTDVKQLFGGEVTTQTQLDA